MDLFIDSEKNIQSCSNITTIDYDFWENSISFLGIIVDRPADDEDNIWPCNLVGWSISDYSSWINAPTNPLGCFGDPTYYCDDEMSDNMCLSVRVTNTLEVGCPTLTTNCDTAKLMIKWNKCIKERDKGHKGKIISKSYNITYDLFRPARICETRPVYPETNCASETPVYYRDITIETSEEESNKKSGYENIASVQIAGFCYLPSTKDGECESCSTCKGYNDGCGKCSYWKYATNPYFSNLFPNDCGSQIHICNSIDPLNSGPIKDITLDDAGICKDKYFKIVSNGYCCDSNFQQSLVGCVALGDPIYLKTPPDLVKGTIKLTKEVGNTLQKDEVYAKVQLDCIETPEKCVENADNSILLKSPYDDLCTITQFFVKDAFFVGPDEKVGEARPLESGIDGGCSRYGACDSKVKSPEISSNRCYSKEEYYEFGTYWKTIYDNYYRCKDIAWASNGECNEAFIYDPCAYPEGYAPGFGFVECPDGPTGAAKNIKRVEYYKNVLPEKLVDTQTLTVTAYFCSGGQV